MNDFLDKLLAPTAPTGPPCPRCSRPAPGPKCHNCRADTSKTYVKNSRSKSND
jgi:hypothetical protein